MAPRGSRSVLAVPPQGRAACRRRSRDTRLRSTPGVAKRGDRSGPARHAVRCDGCGRVCRRVTRHRVQCTVTLGLRAKEPCGCRPHPRLSARPPRAAWSRERPNARRKLNGPELLPENPSQAASEAISRGGQTGQAIDQVRGDSVTAMWRPTGRPWPHGLAEAARFRA